MAWPEDSRRVEHARHPDLGTDRLPAAPEVAATTRSDLEDLPAQSPGSDGFQRLLHRAYDHDEGVVRVPGVEHRRREVLHFHVTEHPCAAWTSRPIVEAFANQDAPQYLLRDRDRIYGNEVGLRISSLQIEEVLTAPRVHGRIPTSNA